jgi:geranylgeranyl pyrophosphate synthase
LLSEQLSKASPWALALPGISCWAAGGALADAIPIAAAWAALHYAACILDAVQDGNKAQTTRFDTPVEAVNLATGLVFVAFRFLDDVQACSKVVRRIASIFYEAGFRSALGQHLDLSQNLKGMPATEALEVYWRAVIYKSGSIFRAGGAAAGTDSERLITALGEFGNVLGVIQQILDDCRDVLVGSETADCEISLPLLLLSTTAENDLAGRQRLHILSTGPPPSREALLQVLHEADVPDIITDVLLEWRRRALNSLTALKHSEAVDALRGIVEHILTSSPLSD